jgi:hypothetical protein
MNRLIITILLCCLLPTVSIAGSYYYTKPDATSLPPSGRILMYDPNTGTDKNITGTVLRSQVAPSTDETLTAISQPTDKALSVQPSSTASPYYRKTEFKDKDGIIKMYINAGGTVVITGQLILGSIPVALAVSSAYPINGATGVDINAVPYVVFNKGANVSLSTLYLDGNSTAPVLQEVCLSGCVGGQIPIVERRYTIPAAPLIHGTTYTMKVVKNSILQTDGETASSCGTAMTDVSGICQSTFVTTPITITGSYPAVGASNVPGTDGQPFSPSMSITLDTPITGYTPGLGDFLLSLDYWTGSGWYVGTYVVAATTSDNLTYQIPFNYKKSYSSSYLTKFGISIKKVVGVPTCPVGWTDMGTSCKFTFTTAP